MGATANVRGRKPEDAVARADQRVLATIVADESLAVIATIELDDEIRSWIVEIGPTDKAAAVVIKVWLHFGQRKSSIG